MTSARQGPLRILSLGAAVALALTLAAAGARGQDADDPDLEARLVGFPLSVGPADSLVVTLEVTNRTDADAGDLEVSLTIFRGVTSRSALHQTYSGRLGARLAVDTFPVGGLIESGATRRIEISKPLRELGSFRDSTLDRAYPVRVLVQSDVGPSDPIETHMVFFHEPPEKPLGLSLVVPLHSPSIYTDGDRPDLVTSSSLVESITTGRLARILAALEAHPALPVTIAPSGLLLSMLQDLSDGFRLASREGPVEVSADDPRAQAAAFTLLRLRTLAIRPGTRVIASPYSPTSLPALNRFDLQELGATQLAEGRNALLAEPRGLLRAEPLDGWLLPSFGAVDQPSLSQIHRANFTRLILAPGALRPTDQTFTRALPVRLQGGSGSATEGLPGVETTALVADDDLAGLIDDAGQRETIVARQRIVAESATIHLETPGLVRAVVAVASPDWEAGGGSAGELLRLIETVPWLTPTTPDEITSRLLPEEEPVRLNSSERALDLGPGLPGRQYFDALAEARSAIARFSALAPPPSQIGAMSRRLLIASSSDWWGAQSSLARGLAFADATPAAVNAELGKVRAPSPQTITFTSRTGVIPLSVGSGLAYPVDVVLRLDSDKLRFPDGNRVEIQNLRPPNQTIRVQAITESSGTFPLRVRLFTPGGTLISDSQLIVRSTAYNVVAVGITAAAALFILAWWVVGWFRRRVGQRHVSDASASPEGGEDPGGAPEVEPEEGRPETEEGRPETESGAAPAGSD